MTAVTSGTHPAVRGVEVLVSGVLCAAIGWCGVLVLRADGRAPRHSVLRDPISWFASDEAPDPGGLRFGLTVVGALFVVLAAVGVVAQRRRAPVVLSAAAGVLVVALAQAPLDCSIRLDYCEALVAAGFASDAHVLHVVLSAGLVVLAVIAVVLDARRSRTRVGAAVALIVAACAAAMFAAPTSDLLGTLQLLTLAGGAWATARLWLSAPTLVSPP